MKEKYIIFKPNGKVVLPKEIKKRKIKVKPVNKGNILFVGELKY